MPANKAIGEQKIETQRIVKLLSALSDGETLTYAEIDRAVGCDVRAVCAHLIRSARKVVERDQMVIIDTVKGVGLKRLVPGQAIGVIKATRQRVQKAAKRGFVRSAHIAYESLTKEEQQKLNAERTVLAFTSEVGKTKTVEALESKTAADALTLAQTVEHFAAQMKSPRLKLA